MATTLSTAAASWTTVSPAEETTGYASGYNSQYAVVGSVLFLVDLKHMPIGEGMSRLEFVLQRALASLLAVRRPHVIIESIETSSDRRAGDSAFAVRFRTLAVDHLGYRSISANISSPDVPAFQELVESQLGDIGLESLGAVTVLGFSLVACPCPRRFGRVASCDAGKCQPCAENEVSGDAGVCQTCPSGRGPVGDFCAGCPEGTAGMDGSCGRCLDGRLPNTEHTACEFRGLDGMGEDMLAAACGIVIVAFMAVCCGYYLFVRRWFRKKRSEPAVHTEDLADMIGSAIAKRIGDVPRSNCGDVADQPENSFRICRNVGSEHEKIHVIDADPFTQPDLLLDDLSASQPSRRRKNQSPSPALQSRDLPFLPEPPDTYLRRLSPRLSAREARHLSCCSPASSSASYTDEIGVLPDGLGLELPKTLPVRMMLDEPMCSDERDGADMRSSPPAGSLNCRPHRHPLWAVQGVGVTCGARPPALETVPEPETPHWG